MVQNYPFMGLPAVYVDPQVVIFTADPAVAELGSSVSSVVLKWALSKQPLTLTVAGQTLQPNEFLTTITGPFTTKQTWKLRFTDSERSVSANTVLDFQNKMYWGNAAAAPASSADILALPTSAFITGKLLKIIQYGSVNGLHPCIAYPARYGPPKRVQIGVNGTSIAIPLVWSNFTDFTLTTVSFTNPSGYIEDYNVVTFNTARNDTGLLVAWNEPSQAPVPFKGE